MNIHNALYNSATRMELEMALLKIPDEDIVRSEYHLFSYDQSKDTSDLSDEETMTYDEPNCMIDGHAFVAARLSGDLQYKREALLYKEFSKDIDRSTGIGSVWGLLMILIGALIASLPLLVVLSSCIEEGQSFSEVFNSFYSHGNAWLLRGISLFGMLLALGGIIRIIFSEQVKRKIEKDSNAFSKSSSKWTKLKKLIDKDLGIPQDAQNLEILSYNYKIIQGEIIEYLPRHAYENASMAVWREGDSLCICDHFSTVKVPLSAIKGYVTVREKCRIRDWWKDEPHNSSVYAPYRIIEEKSGCYLLDGYIRVTVDVPEGDKTRPYLLRLPLYELPVLQKLIALPCLDEEGKKV